MDGMEAEVVCVFGQASCRRGHLIPARRRQSSLRHSTGKWNSITQAQFSLFFIMIRYSLWFLTRSHYPSKRTNEATDAAVHHETKSRGETGALSVQGLVVQAAVFLLVGFSFVYRLTLLGEPEDFDEHLIVNLRDWYWLLGWATINNVIFALGQGLLAWIASRQSGGEDHGEQDPLLA